jgi:uncharacterized membrane protein
LSAAHLASSSLIALIALCVAWELWLAPLRPDGSWLVLKALPLLLPLRGVLHARHYTLQWASLLIWLYAAEGAMRLFTDSLSSRWCAALELLLALLFFAACVAHLRGSRRESLIHPQ